MATKPRNTKSTKVAKTAKGKSAPRKSAAKKIVRAESKPANRQTPPPVGPMSKSEKYIPQEFEAKWFQKW